MSSQSEKKRPRYSKRQQPRETVDEAKSAPLSPYLEVFNQYREELDGKHDRHERLVKLSRDCTIHSKRVIFLLHRISGDSERDKVIFEAEEKMKQVLEILKAIALELQGVDPYKHRSAYSPGLQEFIEALTYLMFLKTEKLVSLEEAQELMTFSIGKNETTSTPDAEKTDAVKDLESGVQVSDESTSGQCTVRILLSPMDFILGVADLTGELMRMSINAVGSGDRNVPFDLLPFVRAVYCGMFSLCPVSKEVPRKLSVLRSSLAKIERTCYTLKIRGSEVPKHMLVHAINTNSRAEAALGPELYDSD